MKIDAHHHFWRVARGDYGWLSSHAEINRDFLPGDYLPLIKPVDIEKTILVQAAPTRAETEFLLEIAGATSFVGGVVGWVDFESKEAPRHIAELARNSRLKGLRPMIQDIADEEWMLRPELAPAFEAMMAQRLRFDALVKPGHLGALRKLLGWWPDLPVVIDHGAKPDIAGGILEPWASNMRCFAKDTRAFCKISGLATEAGRNWLTVDLKPFVDVLMEAFGAHRLMWGSDWPVVNEAGGFARWHETAQALTRHLSRDERDAIFGGTAVSFYGLSP